MTDLTDRMRTCAAHILHNVLPGRGDEPRDWQNDAADLLIEASNIIEAPPPAVPEGSARQETIAETRAKHPPGEPMEIIPPAQQAARLQQPIVSTMPPGTWIGVDDTLPGLKQSGTISPRACPRCDSRAAKRVHRQGNSLVLECSVCGHAWKYT